MASKAVLTLLETATALAQTVDSVELKDSIEALQFLGEEADGRAQEYKDLKEIVEKIQTEEGTQEKKDSEDGKEREKPKEKLSYVGIKQIGSLWYSSKDKYKKSFSTADECAEHFNKE